MKLPFFKQATEKKESYLGLLLQQNRAIGYVYDLKGADISVIGQHSTAFSNGLHNIVEDIDDLLFRLETDTNKKLNKTIFFVTSQYLDVESKQIKKDLKSVIKTIAKELELHPLGFIECFEAVAALIGKKEGTRLNSVIVELDGSFANIVIFKNDKQVHSVSLERSDSLVHDLTKAFINIQGEFMLPPRIVLYPFTESHKELIQLVNHKWSEDLFAHIPKIESLSEEDFHKGLAEIFSSQMTADSSTTNSAVDLTPSEDELDESKGEVVESEMTEKIVEPAVKTVVKPQENKEVMGFTVGSDAGMSEIVQKENTHHRPLNEESTINVDSVMVSPPSKRVGMAGFFSKFRLNSNGMKFPLKLPLIITAIILILIAVLLGSEYSLHKETIKVTFPSKSIEKSVTLTNTDVVIKSGSLSSDVSETISTSGKRDIGEKSKGDVTVHSFDDKEKVISKGTVLDIDGKKFILDQDVKVASASVSSDSTSKTSGEAKGTVVADTIGPDYNIEKGKKFHIGDLSFSTFFAINEAALSGGTKRQAQTVAKKDLDDLKAKALVTGKKQGLDKMRSEVSSDQQIIDSITEQSLDDVKFSKEIGDEAKEVGVKAKVATVYYSYSENELKKALLKNLQPEISSGFSLPSEKIEVKVKDAKKVKEKITLKVDAKGSSVKEVSKDAILGAVTGKSKTEAQAVLKSKFEAVDTQIEDNGLSIFPWIPFFKKNITVKVNSL